MRIVLDTSVLVAALRSRAGASSRIMRRILDGETRICLDYKLSCEYREVAMRPEHCKQSGLSVNEVGKFISTLEDIAESVRMKRRYRGISSDPADDMILEVAINARADAIVTHNLRHLRTPGRRFGIDVLTPGEFLVRMGREERNASKDETYGTK